MFLSTILLYRQIQITRDFRYLIGLELRKIHDRTSPTAEMPSFGAHVHLRWKRPVEVCSDSAYSINCIRGWVLKMRIGTCWPQRLTPDSIRGIEPFDKLRAGYINDLNIRFNFMAGS